jgi:hypothetical protein
MLIARFDPVSNLETWQQTISVIDNDTGSPVDLSAATITVTVEDKFGNQILQATQANGRITISNPGFFTFAFSPNDMASLASSVNDDYFDRDVDSGMVSRDYWGAQKAIEFRVGCLVTINGVTTQLFVGMLPLVRGL